MRPDSQIILWAFALIGLGGPLLLALGGLLWPGREPRGEVVRSGWGLPAASMLAYVLAFNLVFFVQELFLVWPKALVSGLEPVLFHNNHDWRGGDPIAELLQGTGALAILLLGLAALASIDRARTPSGRLLLIWLAFHGAFESLPQVVVGGFLPGNDVGRAMSWLGMGMAAMTIAALVALAAMAAIGMALSARLLALAGTPPRGRGRRMGFLLRIATLPAAFGTLAILAYRVPGSVDQVVLVPVAVAILGIGWVQANGWRARASGPPVRGGVALGWPLAACIAVLAAFQLVLRHGIAF